MKFQHVKLKVRVQQGELHMLSIKQTKNASFINLCYITEHSPQDCEWKTEFQG